MLSVSFWLLIEDNIKHENYLFHYFSITDISYLKYLQLVYNLFHLNILQSSYLIIHIEINWYFWKHNILITGNNLIYYMLRWILWLMKGFRCRFVCIHKLEITWVNLKKKQFNYKKSSFLFVIRFNKRMMVPFSICSYTIDTHKTK